jgi:hypothetical protein
VLCTDDTFELDWIVLDICGYVCCENEGMIDKKFNENEGILKLQAWASTCLLPKYQNRIGNK